MECLTTFCPQTLETSHICLSLHQVFIGMGVRRVNCDRTNAFVNTASALVFKSNCKR